VKTQAKPEEAKEALKKAAAGIANGPRALQLYMEICARCGTCAEQCPVYYGSAEKKDNPTLRTDRIRSLYKRECTLSGRMLATLNGGTDIADGEVERWAEDFYRCTGCRRCATFCPMGIDHSVVTRKARAVLDKLGMTPERLQQVIEISLETGNTDGATPAALKDATSFLEEEMKEATGIDVKIPVDEVGADVFFVPPSGDVLVNPEAIEGIAKVYHVMGVSWTMSSAAFDGANYGLFTGDDESMKADNKLYIEEAKRLKCKTMMPGECGHAYRVFKHMCEKLNWWGDLPFNMINVLEYTSDLVTRGEIKFDPERNPDPVTYHDPCNFGRSCGITEEPRIIMRAACKDFREMQPHGAENWCCGGGGGLSAMDDIREFRMNVSGKKKLEQIRETGAVFLAAPCSNCKRQLMQLMEYHDTGVRVGGVHDLASTAILMD